MLELQGVLVSKAGGGVGAYGWFAGDDLRWHDDPEERRFLERHGAVVDRLLAWYFDPSLPPQGVERADYDVVLP